MIEETDFLFLHVLAICGRIHSGAQIKEATRSKDSQNLKKEMRISKSN